MLVSGARQPIGGSGSIVAGSQRRLKGRLRDGALCRWWWWYRWCAAVVGLRNWGRGCSNALQAVPTAAAPAAAATPGRHRQAQLAGNWGRPVLLPARGSGALTGGIIKWGSLQGYCSGAIGELGGGVRLLVCSTPNKTGAAAR